MNDHGRDDDSSCFRNMSQEDKYGVSWGEELIDDDEADGKRKLKSVKYYVAFYLKGVKYCQNDTVYLRSRDGPPYVGRIGKMYENVQEKKRHMQVRWFCRPCELPAGLPDVDYSKNCKDVFVMWGDGSRSVNNPACTMRHCKVLCTAEANWNTYSPSIEEVAAADHIFDRAYDSNAHLLRPLEVIVKKHGEHFVTGKGEPRRAPSEKRASKPEKLSSGSRIHPDDSLRPLSMRAESAVPPVSVDSELWGRPPLGTSPNVTVALPSLAGRTERSQPKSDLPKSSLAARHSKLSPTASLPGSHKYKDATSVRPKPAEERTALKSAKVAEERTVPKRAEAAEERTVLKSAKQGRERTVDKPIGKPGRTAVPDDSQKKKPRVESSAGPDDSQKKRPRAESSDAQLVPQQSQERLAAAAADHLPSSGVGHGRVKSSSERTTAGPAHSLSKGDRQKGTSSSNASSEPKRSSEPRKRPRTDSSDRRMEPLMLPSHKLGASSHIHDVMNVMGDLFRERNVIKEVSAASASALKSGELQLLREAERNASQKRFSYRDSTGNQTPAFLRRSTDVEKPAISGSPKIVLSDVTQEETYWAREQSSNAEHGTVARPSRHPALEQVAEGDEESPPSDQNDDGNVKHMNLERHVILLSESSADGEERTWSLSTRHGVGEVSAILPSVQNQGKVPPLDDVVPLTSKNAPVSEEDPIASGESPIRRAMKRAGSPDGEAVPPVFKKNRPVSGENRAVLGESRAKLELKRAELGKLDVKTTVLPAGRVVTPPSKKATSVNEDGRIVTGQSQLKTALGKGGSPRVVPRPAGMGGSSRVVPKPAGMGGSPRVVARPAGMGFSNTASKIRPSELELSNPKNKAMSKVGTQPIKKDAQQAGDGLKSKKTGPVARSPIVSPKKRSDENRIGDKLSLPPQRLSEAKVGTTHANVRKLLVPVLAAKPVDRAPTIDTSSAPSVEGRKPMFEPKKKIFNVPWEESLRIALEQEKALHLRNLDPLFSSADIETMLQELLRVSCDVRVLPPKCFTCYTSGEALVLFRTQKNAMEALSTFRDNLFICSDDERPVVVSMADAKMSGSGTIHGFYKPEQFARRNFLNPTEDQPNTVEYEMGVQWRLLQDRHTQAWILADQDHKKALGDLAVKTREQKKQK